MVFGYMKEWVVAKQQVKHHPGSRRCEDYGTEHGGVKVAHYLFEREQNRSDRRVERCREGGRSSDRQQPLHLSFAKPKLPRNHRRQARSDIDRWSLSAERDATGERSRAADEFADNGTERDAPVVNEDRGAGLWDSAAAGEREVPIEQVPRE